MSIIALRNLLCSLKLKDIKKTPTKPNTKNPTQKTHQQLKCIAAELLKTENIATLGSVHLINSIFKLLLERNNSFFLHFLLICLPSFSRSYLVSKDIH